MEEDKQGEGNGGVGETEARRVYEGEWTGVSSSSRDLRESAEQVRAEAGGE